MFKKRRKELSLFNGKNEQIYRGSLELAARFGYISIQEVVYLSGCKKKAARNSLDYLVGKAKLMIRFDSLVRPDRFYCLTSYGRKMVREMEISDEIRDFYPGDYRVMWQNHHRQLTKCFIAFRMMYGHRFLGWMSEAQLKKEYTRTRVVDGEFYLIDRLENGSVKGLVKCWVELELSIKSPARYRIQFKKLADQVYDFYDKVQVIHHLYFLAGSVSILERIKSYAAKQEWGNCVVHFAMSNEFYKNPTVSIFFLMQHKGLFKTPKQNVQEAC